VTRHRARIELSDRRSQSRIIDGEHALPVTDDLWRQRKAPGPLGIENLASAHFNTERKCCRALSVCQIAGTMAAGYRRICRRTPSGFIWSLRYVVFNRDDPRIPARDQQQRYISSEGRRSDRRDALRWLLLPICVAMNSKLVCMMY
jgi:hypothetical protein